MPKPLGEDMDRKWRTESASWRDSLNMSPSFSPWTSRPGVVLEGVGATARVADLFNCITASKMQAVRKLQTQQRDRQMLDVKQIMQNMYTDYTQSHGRRNFTTRAGYNHCFTTTTELYGFDIDRVVMPIEMLMMHGWKMETVIPSSLLPMDLKTMVGNGIALPCLGAVVWGLFLVKQLQPTLYLE
jgi:hypothetical protein